MNMPTPISPAGPLRGFDFLKDVDVRLSVELGRTDMKLREVLSLGEDSVVMLDRLTDELLDVMVNGKVIAKGEIVAQGNRFGLRIVELAGSDGSAHPAATATGAPEVAAKASPRSRAAPAELGAGPGADLGAGPGTQMGGGEG